MNTNVSRALLVAALTCLSVSEHATAQGHIGFSNYVPPQIDAPVYDTDCQTLLQGTAFSAQVYGGVSPEVLQPLSRVLGFGTGRASGYLASRLVLTVPVSSDLQTVYVQLRVWETTSGSSYEQAIADGGKTGTSNLVPMVAHIPPSSADWPVGLESFCLVPEPSTWTLLAFGAGGSAVYGWLQRRKPKRM